MTVPGVGILGVTGSPADWMAAAPAALAALMAAATAFNLARAPRFERAPAPSRRPRVSLLVPARNEEENLRELLPRLRRQDWDDLEILVLDDGSSDGTAEAVREHAPAVRLLEGSPLPAGWLGKSWACAQLAEAAGGDVLLFCDADARPGPEAVAATLGLMERTGAGALTCLPRQLLGTWSEKAVVPQVIHLPVLGLLPLPFVHRHPLPALSVGVGQWFAFTRGAYAAIGGHASVRSALAEDMALARRVKEAGHVLAAALSTRVLAVRMYRGFAGVREGFRKNLVVLTGSGWLKPAAVLGVHLAAFVAPWAMALAAAAGAAPVSWYAPGLLLLAQRLMVASAFREPPDAWLWHPAGSLLVFALALRSRAGFRRRDLAWKGRRLTAAFAQEEAR